MSIERLKAALAVDETSHAVVREFMLVWPTVESVLEAFSRSTRSPIFAYLAGQLIFQSSVETMPPFCSLMLSNPETAELCKQDCLRRASKVEPDIGDRVQYCHAGRVHGRREINAGIIGTLTIFFGAKPPKEPNAFYRRENVISAIAAKHPDLANLLRDADINDEREGLIQSSESAFLDAIAEMIQHLLRATVSTQSLAINMAHELSLSLLSIGALAKSVEDLVRDMRQPDQVTQGILAITTEYRYLLRESRLGLYVVRNFLSHSSETRYQEVVRPQFTLINLPSIIDEMIDLYRTQAAKKLVAFDVRDLELLPPIYGAEMEIRRVLHNVLSNAVKYSYHSVPNAQRTIRVRTRVPYDPGFRQRRFAIIVENYGLGLTKDERHLAFMPGFRGRQAAKEVPVGAGIGLSEAAKIMKIHHGSIRLRSEEVNLGRADNLTFLTTVELIFPYDERREGHHE